jgi:hypothetical protein
MNSRGISNYDSNSSIHYCSSSGCSFLNVYFVLSVIGVLVANAAHKIEELN